MEWFALKKHISNTFNTNGLNLPPNPRKKMMMSFSVWLPLKHTALTISNTRAAKSRSIPTVWTAWFAWNHAIYKMYKLLKIKSFNIGAPDIEGNNKK